MPPMCVLSGISPGRTADPSNGMAGESSPLFAVFLTERFSRAYSISWYPPRRASAVGWVAGRRRRARRGFSETRRQSGATTWPGPVGNAEMRKFDSRASTRTARAGESKRGVGRNSGRKDPKARCHCIGGVRTDPDAGPEGADCPDSSAGAKASVGNAKMRKCEKPTLTDRRARTASRIPGNAGTGESTLWRGRWRRPKVPPSLSPQRSGP
jgi:hypothetical protein